MSPKPCPNCGCQEPGRYCPDCGQPQTEELVPKLSRWLGEVFDELLLIEARLPRTIKALVTPGKLTQEWWAGRRFQFVSPLRLYLLAAIPFFFLLSLQASKATPEDELTLPWFLLGAVEGGYLTADLLVEDSVGFYSYRPLEPLPPELANDSSARAAWSEEFQRRRAEVSRQAETLETTFETTIYGGLDQVLTVLPVVVGVIMVPVLAILLLFGPAPRGRFVGRMVYSLHLHTVGYVLIGSCWLTGVPLSAGLLATSVYLGIAELRIHGGGWRTGMLIFGQVVAVPGAYAGLFLFSYFSLVQGLATLAPGFIFG